LNESTQRGASNDVATNSPVPSPQSQAPATQVRYWVLAIFCIAAAIGYIQRYAINYLNDAIRFDVGLDKDQMGWVMFSFFMAYAVMMLPAGWIADRFGSRRMLAACALSWSIATALMATADNLTELVTMWAVMGAAQAGLFPSAVIGLRKWLPATRRALASGMLASFMNVGAVLSPLAAGALVENTGASWRDIFLCFAAPGMVWAVWYYIWYRDQPREHRAVNAAEIAVIEGSRIEDRGVEIGLRLEDRGSREETQQDADRVSSPPSSILNPPSPVPVWRVLTFSPRMWLICAQHFLRAAAQVFFGTWFATFLRESPGMSAQHVDLASSFPPMMLIVGSLAGGVISDWLLRVTGSRRVSRQGLAVVNLLLCAAMFFVAASIDDIWTRVALICAACFFMTVGGVSSYTITMDLGGAYVATVFSAMNMFGSLGSAAFPKYVGWLVNQADVWNVAPAVCWNYVLYSIVAIYLAAALCWLLIDPNGSLFAEQAENK
jgi:MFS family permease